MLLRDLSKVWISRAIEENDHGEITRTWQYRSISYFNLQQDLNELDRKTTGEVDYSIYKGRTTQNYNIQKGDGVSLTDISEVSEFVPEYRILDINKIGNTYVYRMEKYNGQD